MQAVAAKREVQDAKKPDLLGVSRQGWNNSVASENMQRFPDRPKMRQLSKVRVACCVPVCCRAPPTCVVCARQFDSIKRADYNFRGEQLDWQDKRMYVPRGNKNEFNERQDSSTHRLSVPPALSRTEFPVHSALISKVRSPAPFPPPSTRSDVLCTPRSQTRWDGATGSGGDPYAAEKAHEAKGLAMLQFARDNSARKPPKARETLVRRRACSSRASRRVGWVIRPWQWGVVVARHSRVCSSRASRRGGLGVRPWQWAVVAARIHCSCAIPPPLLTTTLLCARWNARGASSERLAPSKPSG